MSVSMWASINCWDRYCAVDILPSARHDGKLVVVSVDMNGKFVVEFFSGLVCMCLAREEWLGKQ